MSELNILNLSKHMPDSTNAGKSLNGKRPENESFLIRNPLLDADTFSGIKSNSEEVMTIGGTVNRIALSLIILFAAALMSWSLGSSGSSMAGFISFGVIGGLFVAIATACNKEWAPYTTLVYAALEGMALGGISVAIDRSYPGVVSQGVFLTFGIFVVMLLAYRLQIIRPSEKFQFGVIAATGGIAVLYLMSFIFGTFGVAIPVIHSSSTLGFLFSIFVIIVASLNLVLDFELIDVGVKQGAPKHMEWYAAFALTVTLIWIYVELIRLLGSSEE